LRILKPKSWFIDLQFFNMVQTKVEIIVASNNDEAKSVSFSRRVQVKRTLVIWQYSVKEFRACWYSSDEYNMMKREVKYTVRKMEKKRNFDEEKLCSRGLEAKTKEGSKRRWSRKKEGIGTVLDEQHEQIKFGVQNEHRIADVYQNGVHDCKVSAYLRGASDEHIARSFLSGTRNGEKNIKDATEATGSLNRMQRCRRQLSGRYFFPPVA
jgi:hypothetical protein